MTFEQQKRFAEIVRSIVDEDANYQESGNFDAGTQLLNELYYCGVSNEEFEHFVQIIQDANDSDNRSPK